MYYHETEDIGEHRSAMIRIAYDLFHGRVIELHKGSIRGWLHMDDAVVALERTIYLETFSIINIKHPYAIRTEDLAKQFCDVYNT